MTDNMGYQTGLIQNDFMIPGAEKRMKLIGPNSEWAYMKVTTHEFNALTPREKSAGYSDVNQAKINEDADEASTRKGRAQPSNKDNSTAKDADADQASTRKGNFQPEPENSPD